MAGLEGEIDVGTVIEDIVSARHRYVVDTGGQPTWVFVVRDRSSGRMYLRTGPDRETSNNLDGLPSCPSLPAAQTTPVRRDVATVDDDERTRLRDAILELNRRFLSPDDQVSVWFKQDQIHQATHVHGNTYQASFLAWHRVLINEFERQLQQIDSTLALHYWDWTTDPRRAPDGRGGTVDLMTPEFMGGSNGPVGTPFLEAGFYRPISPNREDAVPGAKRAALPPKELSRKMMSGTPRDATGLESDEAIVKEGLDPRPGAQFEKLWRAIYRNHTLAHLFIGGNIGGFGTDDVAHRSFEDPFVYLLHSNVDRLWASWQLNQSNFVRWQEPSWRVEPLWSYGQLIDDKLEETALTSRPGESQADYDKRYEEELRRDSLLAGQDIKSTMRPWNGLGSPRLDPWAQPGAQLLLRPIDRDVLRPPLYDRYTFDDNLCAAWTTLLGGKRLSTHDVVRLSVEIDADRVPQDQVEFVLKTGPDVSWWKALRLPDSTRIETDGANATARATHPAVQLAGGELVFHKLQGAVFPGRRIVFRIADLGWIKPGSRLTFYWEDD